MEQDGYQQILATAEHIPSRAENQQFQCHQAWDFVEARFDECFLPVISAIPALLAVGILLGVAVRHVICRRPQWTEPFIKEACVLPEDLAIRIEKRSIKSMVSLTLASLLGLASQVAVLLSDGYDTSAAIFVFTWATAALVVSICRPRTTPFALLGLYTTLLLSQFTLLFDRHLATRFESVGSVVGLFAAFAATASILLMPMRDPDLPNDEICPVSVPPHPQLRSPEDNLTLWQFMTVSWMSPLISLGTKRQLNDQDVWLLSHEFQHRALHDRFRELPGSLLRRVLVANIGDIIFVGTLGIVEVVANLSIPVLLQQLLRSMQDPQAPKRAAAVYAVLSLIARLIASQSGVFRLWFSRRSFERSRGEMITMLYEKMLRRKVTGLHQRSREDMPDAAQDSARKHKTTSGKESSPTSESASTGKILNLMRNDVYEVAQRFWESSYLTSRPLGLILSTILIWRLIGWPCMIGVLTIFVAQAINALVARALIRWERLRRVATDIKLQVVSQFVEAIRHLRWYGWQEAWLIKIMEARQHELNLRIITSVWSIMISFTNTFASGMFPVAAFAAYTYLAGQPLRIDVAFPALQLFTQLEVSLRDIPALLTAMLNAYVAIQRLETFMGEPDKPESELSLFAAAQLEMKHTSFAWPGAAHLVLHDITLAFPTGLTVICGKVGAGKSALLQGLLGELDHRHGDVVRPTRNFGYCGQTPWLQSMSIRENILFSSSYDEVRYKQVITACALTEDLASFKHGDLSNIGENGIGLSGGQKARVALARAVYSETSFLLLDDPLSALDQQTAEWVVRRCLAGPLLAGRTTVLVTHRTDLCRDIAQQVVEVSDGRAHILGVDASVPNELHLTHSGGTEKTDGELDTQQQLAAIPDKFIEDEYRATGDVRAQVYWAYIKAAKLRWWVLLVVVLATYRLVAIGETWFLKQWGEGSSRPEESSELMVSNPFKRLPSPESDVRPWLIGFFLLALAQSVMFLVSRCVMLVIIYIAGRRMFKDIMVRISYATFRFYDVTPVGRLMNRLTSDIGTIDGNISEQFHGVVQLLIEWVFSIAVIASVTPGFLVFSIVLTIAFALIFLRFLPTSQSLRRLEMVSLSPLLSNFGALSEGLTTVRAFGAQHRFQDRVIAVTDAFQQMDHFYWTLQGWLMYRFDILSACSTCLLALLALYTNVSPGLTAFVLVAASNFVTATHSLCRQYGQLQMDFVSVERVVEMLHLEQEPSGTTSPPAWWPSYNGDIMFEDVTVRYAPHLDPALRSVSFSIKAGSNTAIIGRTGSGKSTLALALLATTLPESGRILMDNIDIAKVDTQALRSRVTFLAQEPLLFPGTIRQNLDPLNQHTDAECAAVLTKVYESTTSSSTNPSIDSANPDGSSQQQPQESPQLWRLSTQIDTGGRNLSQGQRQLIGLARALLRKSALVILDEATASIDLQTALRIQRILREEMSQSTVVTIAHRLEAIREADWVVVLGEGRLVDEGTVEDVLGRLNRS